MKHTSRIAFRLLVVMALLLTSVVAFAQDVETEDTNTAIPFIGIRFFEADDGVLVTGIISNTPATNVNIEAGDIVTAVDGEPVDAITVQETVWNYTVDDTVTLSVDRDGDTFETDVTLMERPENLFNNPMYRIPFDLSTIGLITTEFDDQVMVVGTVVDSQAEEVGFEVNDIITRVDGMSVDSVGEAAVAMSDLDYGDELQLYVNRGDQRLIIRIIIRDSRSENGKLDITSTYETDAITLGYGEGMIQILELADTHPFADAGLQVNDIISAVNGETVAAMNNLFGSDSIDLTIERGDSVLFYSVPNTIAPLLMFGNDAPQTQEAGEWLGLHEKQVTLGVRYLQLEPNSPYFDGSSVTNGAYIVETIAGLPAAQAGVQVGDIIISVDQVNTTMELDLRNVIYMHQPGQKVVLEVLRNGEIIELEVTLRVATS